uniref:Uncharacterized protein n=2 Tax=Aegilops tauschii subsp. strangulata TaxID=200361 RepID=A0A453CZM6_AEGTS
QVWCQSGHVQEKLRTVTMSDEKFRLKCNISLGRVADNHLCHILLRTRLVYRRNHKSSTEISSVHCLVYHHKYGKLESSVNQG